MKKSGYGPISFEFEFEEGEGLKPKEEKLKEQEPPRTVVADTVKPVGKVRVMARHIITADMHPKRNRDEQNLLGYMHAVQLIKSGGVPDELLTTREKSSILLCTGTIIEGRAGKGWVAPESTMQSVPSIAFGKGGNPELAFYIIGDVDPAGYDSTAWILTYES